MLEYIESVIVKKFKSWKAYEVAAGIPARHGKRRMQLYVTRLEKILKPLGLTIKIVKEKSHVND